MATESLIKTGSPIVWADSTDYSSTVSGLTRTHQIDLTSVASGAARQGAKADLGALRAGKYDIFLALEILSSAASLELIDLYFSWSTSATAGNANPGGCTGADAAYTGTAGDDLTDSLLQLEKAGSLTTTLDNTTVVQYQKVGEIYLPDRYVSPVLVNGSSGALMTDAVEMYIAMLPIIDEFQNV